MGQPNIEKYFSRLEEVFLELVRTLHSELANQMVSGITGSQFFVLKKINEKDRRPGCQGGRHRRPERRTDCGQDYCPDHG
jgi:hypothetical protein